MFPMYNIPSSTRCNMTSMSELKIPSTAIVTIWNAINTTQGNEIELTQLKEKLNEAGHDEELVECFVKEAITTEIIVENERKKQRGRQKSSLLYTLPREWQSYAIPAEQPDKYCYECHNGGDVAKCDGCIRSFHVGCTKTAEERQLELEQFMLKQKRITASAFKSRKSPGRPRRASATSLAVTEESTNSSSDLLAGPFVESSNENQLQVVESSEDVIMVERYEGPVKQESIESHGRNIKREAELKEEDFPTDEAMFVCMVRPPDRRLERSLNTPTVKPEESLGEGNSVQMTEDINTARYCYACKLLQDSTNHAPPNVGRQELNYLLNFVVERYKTWLPKDTFSTSKIVHDKSSDTVVLKRRTIDICKKMLLRIPTSLADVREKIANQQYASLEEFQVDLLDIVHNIAIIHGDDSIEYSAAMYLLGDCVYDIAEIRQCPDCYRHSSERAEASWFARPCRTRHELVFAKQNRFKYWPAKIIRMLNNRYDVRFFGGSHARAIIDAECVKPIDTDLGMLGVKANKHGGFQQAIREMQKYQSLAEGFREHFAFTSVTEEMQEVINCTVESLLPPELRDGNGIDRSFHVDCTSKSQAKKRKSTQPSVVHQSVPLGSVSPPPNVASTSDNDRSSRAKRRETQSHLQTPTKRTRSSNQEDAETPEQQNGSSNSEIVEGNQDGFRIDPADLNASTSTRMTRTKQKENYRFNESYEMFRFKQQLLTLTDLHETKVAAFRYMESKEKDFVRRQEWLKETHKQEISDVKKKQWCAVCEKEARIPCCWNTSYCRTDCKERHWSVHQKQHLDQRNRFVFAQPNCSTTQNGV